MWHQESDHDIMINVPATLTFSIWSIVSSNISSVYGGPISYEPGGRAGTSKKDPTLPNAASTSGNAEQKRLWGNGMRSNQEDGAYGKKQLFGEAKHSNETLNAEFK